MATTLRTRGGEVTVRLADSRTEDLSPQQREAITGAVQATIDEEDMNGNGGGGRGDDR